MNEPDADQTADENAYIRTAFLKRVAHELRGPASVIYSVLQELESELPSATEQQRALFDSARRGVHRIVRTADRLQETGVLEAGKLQLARVRWDLGVLTRKAIANAQAIEMRRSIDVQLEVPERAVVCSVDSRWISTALYELASNAIRHARARVEVRVVENESGAEVTFTDDNTSTGEFRPLRFESRMTARGLGLALAIVRDVAEAHGGSLRIELGRSVGRAFGARVRLCVPRGPAEEQDWLQGSP